MRYRGRASEPGFTDSSRYQMLNLITCVQHLALVGREVRNLKIYSEI